MRLIIVLTIFQALIVNCAPLFEREACSAGFVTVTNTIIQALNAATPALASSQSVTALGGVFFQSLSTSSLTPQVSVKTTSISSGAVQILPSLTSQLPGTSGSIITSLQTAASAGAPTKGPIISTSIANPTSLLQTASAIGAAIPIAAIAAPTPNVAANIFQPVAVNAPPSVFGKRSDHPVPRLGIKSQTRPLSTNKFYANFFLGSQASGTWTHPYSVGWAKGSGNAKSWGLFVTHIEATQRAFGPDASANPAQFFINPLGIQSLILSAPGLGASTAISTDTLTDSSVNVNFHPSSGAAAVVSFPLVQGMGFVTAVYTGGTPQVQSSVFFRSLTRVTPSPKAGVTKYRIILEDGKTWLLYAYSTSGATLTLQVINNTLIKATSNWNGIIQVAKAPTTASEAIYDASAGAYATSTTITGSVNGQVGTYNFVYARKGLASAKLLMFALPHHVQSFGAATKAAVAKLQLQTTTKGIATAVVGNSWTLVEPKMPKSMSFAPWKADTGTTAAISKSAIALIKTVATSEVSQDMNAQSNLNSYYYSGKALAKFAGVVWVLHDVVKDASLAKAGLTNLKAAFERFSTNKNIYPLVHETAWGGLVSTGSYVTKQSGEDFGNTYYNDHHFHYGYFIYTAAVIGYLDPTWIAAHAPFVNSLVRDTANPSTSDPYFPVSRMFDWYHGHSWAHGLYETGDGKDEESSSEDTMFAYALKMWGKTVGDANMEARGNLQLSILARSLQSYFLYTSNNAIEPSNFVGNKVSGILFENKIDHTTYFGRNIEYIQGIHMLPLLPASALTRTKTFVSQEWSKYFDQGRAAAVQGGWKGILYANLALSNPASSWSFFASSTFNNAWLDGGASRTWYLAFAAGLGGGPA